MEVVCISFGWACAMRRVWFTNTAGFCVKGHKNEMVNITPLVLHPDFSTEQPRSQPRTLAVARDLTPTR